MSLSLSMDFQFHDIDREALVRRNGFKQACQVDHGK